MDMRMMKIIWVLAVVAGLVAVSGCIGQSSSGSGSDNPNNIPELPDNPTSEQVEQRDQTIGERAVSGTVITLADCEPVPEALRVTEGTTIKFVNPDYVMHRIFIAGDSYRIYENSYFELMAKFIAGKGIYSYTCDEKESAGYVVVE